MSSSVINRDVADQFPLSFVQWLPVCVHVKLSLSAGIARGVKFLMSSRISEPKGPTQGEQPVSEPVNIINYCVHPQTWGSHGLATWKQSTCPYIKVCGPCVVTLLNWTPTVEWYMAWLVLSMNYRFHNAIALCAHNIIDTITEWIVSITIGIWEGLM
jgi:hypothetical protein